MLPEFSQFLAICPALPQLKHVFGLPAEGLLLAEAPAPAADIEVSLLSLTSFFFRLSLYSLVLTTSAFLGLFNLSPMGLGVVIGFLLSRVGLVAFEDGTLFGVEETWLSLSPSSEWFPSLFYEMCQLLKRQN
jgi:hypothetical protein